MEGETRQPQRRVAGAVVPGAMVEIDLDDACARREDQRFRELLLADGSQDGCDRLPSVRVEGATEVADVDSGEATEHAVDERRGQRPAPGVLAASASTACDV